MAMVSFILSMFKTHTDCTIHVSLTNHSCFGQVQNPNTVIEKPMPGRKWHQGLGFLVYICGNHIVLTWFSFNLCIDFVL